MPTDPTPGQHDDLLETVAVHIRWLRRDGIRDLPQARTDNTQSADYLEQLAAALRAQTAETKAATALAREVQEANDRLHLVAVREEQAHANVLAELAEARAAAPQPLMRVHGHTIGLDPAEAEFVIYRAGQLPADVTREQVRAVVEQMVGVMYDPPRADVIDCWTDQWTALLGGEGSDGG